MKNEDLSQRDCSFIIVASETMKANDCPNEKSRWDYALEVADGFAELCGEDAPKGIEVIICSNSLQLFKNVKSANVKQISELCIPNGTSDAAEIVRAIKMLCDGYLVRKPENAKPLTILVYMDGDPENPEDFITALIDIAKKIDEQKELKIEFNLVGGNVSESCKFLRSLPQRLTEGQIKFDIVEVMDAVPILDTGRTANVD